MTVEEILAEIQPLGKESYKMVLLNHGVQEPVFGVKIEDLKKILKRSGTDYQLALALYDTGIYDAMYLAGLMADDLKMSKKDLKGWVKKANCYSLAQFTVPWVAAGSQFGHELALEWIEAKKEFVASAGWATLGYLAALKDDSELDLAELKQLLQRVQKSVHEQPNRVRYVMMTFVIAVGCYVAALTDLALATATKIGPVSVDMGDTACKVPNVSEYIRKVQSRGAIGKKRKTVKC
jgi:3-methyladenine DNA glycosylase AlkD